MPLVVALVAGCSSMHAATLPRVSSLAPEDGFKLLKPRARVVQCDGGLFPGLINRRSDLADQALRELLSSDAEGNTLIDLRIEWRSWSIGVYGRQCIAMEGDLVRPTATVLLPMAGDHSGHHGP